jgi:four helix bundle protein
MCSRDGIAEDATRALILSELRANRCGHAIAKPCERMTITSYRDLEAWQLGMTRAENVYALTRTFPREELFGLTAQLRRAAVAIPSNVAEGHRHGTNAYRHDVIMALGSQAECETQLELASRLKLAPADKVATVLTLAARVGQVLHGLARSLPRT